MTAVHCHLCGATLRQPEQFHELARPDHNDVIYLCRDETRCGKRATYDQHSTSPNTSHAKVSRGKPDAILPPSDPPLVPAASLEPADGRQRKAHAGRRIPIQEPPIHVHEKDGGWQVDYGSYAQGYHSSREAAIEKATADAARENREVTIEKSRIRSDGAAPESN